MALALLAWSLPALALAQGEPPTGQVSPERALPFVFAVFAVTWAAFFGYALFMARRQRDLQREVQALRQMLEKKGKE